MYVRYNVGPCFNLIKKQLTDRLFTHFSTKKVVLDLLADNRDKNDDRPLVDYDTALAM